MTRFSLGSIVGAISVPVALLTLMSCSQPDYVPVGTTDQQTSAAGESNYVEGEISQVSESEGTITVTDLNGQQREIAIAEDAEVRLDGDAVPLDELNEGHRVGIEADIGEEYPVALIVEAWTPQH